MPSWLTLALVLLGCTLVAPLWALGHTQRWRVAWEAWWKTVAVLLALASPALLLVACQFIIRS